MAKRKQITGLNNLTVVKVERIKKPGDMLTAADCI